MASEMLGEKYLLRNHSDPCEPHLYQSRPSCRGKFCGSQPERVPALRVRMHLHWNSSLFQGDVVTQCVFNAIDVVILVLQQERGRSLSGDVIAYVRIQRDAVIGKR